MAKMKPIHAITAPAGWELLIPTSHGGGPGVTMVNSPILGWEVDSDGVHPVTIDGVYRERDFTVRDPNGRTLTRKK